MTDEIFFEAEEELSDNLGRQPTYEEVMECLNQKYKEKSYVKPKSERDKFERSS